MGLLIPFIGSQIHRIFFISLRICELNDIYLIFPKKVRALKMIQPDYPSAMGLLSHLNSDELKEMLNDDTKFDSVLKDVKQVKINKKSFSVASYGFMSRSDFLDLF